MWHDRGLAMVYGAAIGGWIYLIASSALALLARRTVVTILPTVVAIVIQYASIFAMLLAVVAFVVFQRRFLKVSEKDKPQPIADETNSARLGESV